MFGFGNKQAAAIDETDLYIRSILSGLGEEARPLPPELFADPYVLGFLELLTVHATATVYRYRTPKPEKLAAIMASAVDRIVPGSGNSVGKLLAELKDPADPDHADYRRGREDGSAHVHNLMATDEIARNQRYHAFRAYIEARFL